MQLKKFQLMQVVGDVFPAKEEKFLFGYKSNGIFDSRQFLLVSLVFRHSSENKKIDFETSTQ